MNLKPLTTVGVAGTTAWIVCVILYAHQYSSWAEFHAQKLNDVADFFGGITAPLAFWWLVIGYFQQGIELRQNVEALKQQSEETANLVRQAQAQAEAIKANELHARKDTFFRYAELIVSHQNMLVARLVELSAQAPNKIDVWQMYGSGATGIFYTHAQYAVIENYKNYREYNSRDAARWGSVQKLFKQIAENYESLWRYAAECDEDHSIRHAYQTSHMGIFYDGLCGILERPPIHGAR